MKQPWNWSLTIWGPLSRRTLSIDVGDFNIPDDEMDFITETIKLASKVIRAREKKAAFKVDKIPEHIYPRM